MGADHDNNGGSNTTGRVARPVDRVVVVGAGIAGLTVANALVHGGVDCVVVEARRRFGGRLHTIDLAGSPVDLGGSWIHHPVGNPMRDFADRVGVACRGGDPLPELTGFDCAESRRLSKSEVEASLALLNEAFPQALDGLRAELGPGASMADGIEAFLGAADLAPPVARRARQLLRSVVEADAADLPDRQSLRWMWTEVEFGGSYFGDLPAGGYRSLVEAMARGVDVRLGFDVAEVVRSAGGAHVRSTGGAVEEGSHVVVTVPLGALKRGRPMFSPTLPAARVAAIERLGFGHYEKVALRFDEPFWRAAGISHLMLFPHDPAEATVWVFDHDAFGTGPTLVCHVFHSAAGHVLDATPDQAVQWVLDMLREALGGPPPAPTATAVTAWANDPYTGGAYTHVAPGADPADADLLGEPVGGRVLFAGEHTQSERLAYADGAMSSGLREARRLMGRPNVQLGL